MYTDYVSWMVYSMKFTISLLQFVAHAFKVKIYILEIRLKSDNSRSDVGIL
jgi:hypothetical protein